MGIYAVIRIKSINSMKATTSGGKLQVGGRKFCCRAGVGECRRHIYLFGERQCTVIMIYHTW